MDEGKWCNGTSNSMRLKFAIDWWFIPMATVVAMGDNIIIYEDTVNGYNFFREEFNFLDITS